MDLAATLAQMYANARPQFQAHQAQMGRLPSTGTVRPGYGSIGQKFGEGFAHGVEEGYVKPLAEQRKQEALWNSPQGRRGRVQGIVELYNKMPQELQASYLVNPNVQKTLADLAQDSEGLINPELDPQTGQMLYKPVTLARSTEQMTADVFRQNPNLMKRGVVAPIEEKEAGTEQKLAEARVVAPAQANYYGAGAFKNLSDVQVDQTLLPERIKGLQAETGLRGAQMDKEKAETGLLPFEARTRRISAEAHRTSAENQGKENTAEALTRRAVLVDDLNLDKILGETDKLIMGKDALGRPVADATTSYVWSAKKLNHLRNHLSTLTSAMPEYAVKRAPHLLNEAVRTVGGLSSLTTTIAGTVGTKAKDLALLKEALDESIKDALMIANQVETLTGQKMEKAPLEIIRAKELSAQLGVTLKSGKVRN